MDFKGKTVLVTGAAVGIGRACAHRFANYGAKVALVDINGEQLETVKKELEGFEAMTFVCDVSDEASVNRVVKECEKVFGSVDVLVNNAALWRSFKDFCEISTEEWMQFLNINVMGTVYFSRAVLPSMCEKNFGRIINVASVAGVYGNAAMAHYSATKGAVIAMTKAIAKEVAEKGVTVNSVSPGSVSPAAEADMDYTKETPLSYMGRTGSDNENAELICFLASKEASYISGENIIIDGCRKKI